MMDSYRLAGPCLRSLPPEIAHKLAILALRAGLVAPAPGPDDPVLASKVWSFEFANPIGLAAGFDKDAETMSSVARLGFGFIEIGSVTPLPQPGNPKPRMFRLKEDGAIINRLGFNSRGLKAVRARLERHRIAERSATGGHKVILGANLAKNRDSAEASEDYVRGVKALSGLVDYLVINISSPNTLGLRDLQAGERLAELIARVTEARNVNELCGTTVAGRPPLLVKLAPDLTSAQCEGIADVVLTQQVDGLIIANSTVMRPEGLRSQHQAEHGGLSGRPLFGPSTAVLSTMHRLTHGRMPLIGCGGVSSGRDAYTKIRAGASLVQLYTAMVYQGPTLIGRIKSDLAELLHGDGFACLSDAVGADHV